MTNQQSTGKYVLPTPAGAFHLACQKREETPASTLFANILKADRLVPLTLTDMKNMMGLNDRDFATQIEAIYSLGWLEEHEQALALPEGSLETVLPQLMASLSSVGQALLADEHGLCLFHAGLSEEDAEALAAMTADLSAIYDKYEAVYGRTMLPTQAWSMVDAAGNSQLGVWPIHVGEQNFNLLIQGVPRLNHPNFVIITWLLYSRYFGN